MTTKTASRKTVTGKPAARSAGPAKPVKKHKKEKKADGKVKVMRDSFTMPHADYALIAAIKQQALDAGLHVKKSELLRAGLHALAKFNVAQLKRAISGLEKIKTGRPKKA